MVLGSQRKALSLTGIARSTWQYRHHPRARVADPIPQADRSYPTRITRADRVRIGGYIEAAWEQGCSVDQAFAKAWDAGIMLGSRRSWWRIAARIEQSKRPIAPTARRYATPQRSAPVLQATGPGQVWSWDITDLRGPFKGVNYKAYSIIDIFSRELVGYRTEEREVDELAKEMFEEAFAKHGIPDVVHADSGPAMRSNAVQGLLNILGVTASHSRPSVSNDNPFF